VSDPAETAALMTALDIVMTVCSSVVRLGVARGARMPWYPSVEPVRQACSGD
jgi:hypothetical protein